jgi:hypothetical protein
VAAWRLLLLLLLLLAVGCCCYHLLHCPFLGQPPAADQWRVLRVQVHHQVLLQQARPVVQEMLQLLPASQQGRSCWG